jgi:hypothetical protein
MRQCGWRTHAIITRHSWRAPAAVGLEGFASACRLRTMIERAPDCLRHQRSSVHSPRAHRAGGRRRGKHLREPYEAWINTDLAGRGVRVIITGPHGFQRQVAFASDEEPETITEMVQQTLEK